MVLPLLVRVHLEVMTMKGYSILPSFPELEPNHQIQFSVIPCTCTYISSSLVSKSLCSFLVFCLYFISFILNLLIIELSSFDRYFNYIRLSVGFIQQLQLMSNAYQNSNRKHEFLSFLNCKQVFMEMNLNHIHMESVPNQSNEYEECCTFTILCFAKNL